MASRGPHRRQKWRKRNCLRSCPVRQTGWERSQQKRGWIPTEKKKKCLHHLPLLLLTPWVFYPEGAKNSICQKEEKVSPQRTERLSFTLNAGIQQKAIHTGEEYRSNTISFEVSTVPWTGYFNFWIETLFLITEILFITRRILLSESD